VRGDKGYAQQYGACLRRYGVPKELVQEKRKEIAVEMTVKHLQRDQIKMKMQ